jgi:hypothetical protein
MRSDIYHRFDINARFIGIRSDLTRIDPALKVAGCELSATKDPFAFGPWISTGEALIHSKPLQGAGSRRPISARNKSSFGRGGKPNQPHQSFP